MRMAFILFLFLILSCTIAFSKDDCVTHLNNKDYKKAEQCFNNMSTFYNGVTKLTGLASVYSAQGKYKEAVKVAEKAYKYKKNKYTAYVLGTCLTNYARQNEEINNIYLNSGINNEFTLVKNMYGQVVEKEVNSFITKKGY